MPTKLKTIMSGACCLAILGGCAERTEPSKEQGDLSSAGKSVELTVTCDGNVKEVIYVDVISERHVESVGAWVLARTEEMEGKR